MRRRLAVLRPESGNAATVARARDAGFDTLALPLFAIAPVAWAPPDPTAYDALILTSANALRFGGAGLAELRTLPVLAVGARTAAAARAAGFGVARTGSTDAAALLAEAGRAGFARALHLTGRDRTLNAGGSVATVIAVYDNAALDVDPAAVAQLHGSTALLHSARTARRLAALFDCAGRADVAIAAFSQAIAAEAGSGWAAVAVAATPDDAALFAAIERPAHR